MNQPDVAFDRGHNAGTVFEKLDVAWTDISLPWIIERQGDVVDDIGGLFDGKLGPCDRFLRPAYFGIALGSTEGAVPFSVRVTQN